MTGQGKRDFAVERSIEIAAAPERVHALINDFHQWPLWSPWEQIDPAMRREYAGPESGVDASYAWSGNRKAGSGSMRITESEPARKVVADLNFDKPFKAKNVITFTLEPTAAGTSASWRMEGTNSLLFSLLGKVMSMDKMVGKDFEKGLAALKSNSESA